MTSDAATAAPTRRSTQSDATCTKRSILVLNRWPRFPGTARWDNELVDYGALIDHRVNKVVYLCDLRGTQGLHVDGRPPANLHVFEHFHDAQAVLTQVHAMLIVHGAFDDVIAFSEHLLEVAALIREAFDIPGPRPAEVARCRDKTLMKSLVSAHGVRVPRWRHPGQIDADGMANTASELVRALGLPLIVKPVRGASSKGVIKAVTTDELAAALHTGGEQPLEIEEYIDAPIMHADGIVDAKGSLVFLSVARYISTCLAFESGSPLGSVLQTEPALLARAEAFTSRCTAALDLRASAFHLEFFDTKGEFTFLEIGARVPGADVPYVVREVRGVNLFQAWVDVMLGRPMMQVASPPSKSGGWLMVARPQPLPCQVLASTSLLHMVPGLYRELIPSPGDWLEESDGYATLQGGRFLFKATTPEAVEKAIQVALDSYQLTVTREPVDRNPRPRLHSICPPSRKIS